MPGKTNTTAATAVAKPALLPKLRFPGFMDPWANEPLSEVLTEHRLKNTEGRDVFSVSMEHGIVNQIELLGRSFAASDTSHYTVGRRYDVVYTKSPLKAFPFGIVKQCKFDGEVALSPLYGVFTPKTPHVGLMIEAYFESPNRSIAFLTPLCQKGAKNTIQITNLTFLSGRLPLPTEVLEQQKIADCLSSVDQVIAAQARKVEALRTHKKGLMQQLFPREGETQPRLRFPEFQDDGRWEETRLGELGALVSGLTYSPDDVRESGLLVLRSSNVQNGEIALDDNVFVDPSIKGANPSQPNDILICVRNGSKALIGKSALIPEGLPACTHGAFMTVFRAQAPRFVFQLFQTTRYQKQVAADLGATINSINGSQLLKYTFFVPKPPEQHRIASFLWSLDTLISAETLKLGALQRHKRGLMQQLFPFREEEA
jgi:type I restriction enzyme S subunit